MKKRWLQICAVLLTGALFFSISMRTKHFTPGALQGTRALSVQEERDEMDAPEEFARYHQEIRTGAGQTEPHYPMNYTMIELNKAIAHVGVLNKSQALTWVERGPGNVGGRTRGLVVDPDDATKMTWFAGSVGGGIWKTTDGGQSWVTKTANAPNLSIASIVMANSNHNIMYAATGEGFGNIDGIKGNGIFKSTNRGEAWSQLASTANNTDFSYVNRVIVDPANDNTVLAATNSGIFRSTDGGTSWSQVYSSGGTGGSYRIQDLKADPTNFQNLYAARNSIGVLKSTNGGTSWSLSNSGLKVGVRHELAIAPSDPTRIYVAIEVDGSNSALYASDNSGASWTEVKHSTGTPPNWLNGQGWYDNTIAVHPYNKDIVFVGGVDLYKIQLLGGTINSRVSTGVDTINTGSFLGGVNWGGPYLGGSVGNGDQFLPPVTNIVDSTDYVTVELRFGPGKSQKAARFVRNVITTIYEYKDYVTIPLEAWDITNNRQITFSFRDSEGDGAFNLLPFNSTTPQREYMFIHAVAYNATTPHDSIVKDNGYKYKNIYAMWPYFNGTGTWNASALPSAILRINSTAVIIKTRSTTKLTNWYSGLPNPAGGTYPYVHADHHNITVIPIDGTNFRILDASDGGIGYSTNGGDSWTNPNTSYVTSQFYGADKKPGAEQYFGGLQDNGTWTSPVSSTAASAWTNNLGGDGFNVAWHYTNPAKMIGSIYYNDIRRTINGGTSWASAKTDLTDNASTNAPFITMLAKSNSDPDLLFAIGLSGIWRSDNFADDWTLFPIAATNWGFGSGANAAISLKNPQIVWAGIRMSNSGTVGKIHVSTNGGVSFTPTTNSFSVGRLSGFATHPTDESTAYALFSVAQSPKILRTTNLGQTWEDISGFGSGTTSTNGFPDVAVYSLLVMPNNPTEIWAGTEIGIFSSTNNGATWAYANNGLPAVSIWQMRAVDDQIVVATHGRGVWTTTIPTVTPPAVTLSPRLNKSLQAPDGSLAINISLRSGYDSTVVLIDSTRFAAISVNAAAKDTLFKYPVAQSKTLKAQIVSYKGGKPYWSIARSFTVTATQAPRTSYTDNLNTSNTNFTSNGFTLLTPTGFTSQAYHSAHPYSSNRDYTLSLNIPIIVSSTNAFVRFDEIAIVEPGDPGSVYGDATFYDYCIVEASKDGSTWLPIEDGYDARRDAGWLNAFNAGSSGTVSLIKNHQMSLLSKFSPGDQVLIRFRMYADPFVTGWGWMIDNIEIQASLVSVEQGSATIPTSYGLAQNYPNPFNPSTTIRFALPAQSRVSLKIYDGIGREVHTLLNKELPAGYYAENWNATGLASGIYFYRLQADEISATGKRSFVETKKLILLK